MKSTLAKYLLPTIALVVAAFSVEAQTVHQASSWQKLSQAYNKASNGDIIEITGDFYMTGSLNLRKSLTFRSRGTSRTYAISSRSTSYGITIYPGSTLTLTNIIFDGKSVAQKVDLFTLSGIDLANSVNNTKVSRMIMQNGSTIRNVTLTTAASADHAPVHVKEGAVLTIQPGAAILNCRNNSYHGKGGAICCDWGTVIMTGGTISGCKASGPGGAIHTSGTRMESVDNYGINARGDIYISGGYITNNVCGSGNYGGGIYLGNTGPMLHITGSTVISNNVSGSGASAVADDVSTYLLNDDFANRLKLVGHMESPVGFTYEGIRFTGWVGVRYPDKSKVSDPEGTRFGGEWEYFSGTRDEPRQFFWNGDNSYRGWLDGNALVWSKHLIHELPMDATTIKELIESGEGSPLYIELNDDYKMGAPVHVPDNYEIIVDLQGHLFKCDFHVDGSGKVTIRDSDIKRQGRVWGHRESESSNAFVLEGGSYHTYPPAEWVATNRVLIGNYDTNFPWTVAQLAWRTNLTERIADTTGILPSSGQRDVRVVSSAADLDKITFSTGDWVHMAYTNRQLQARIAAVAVATNPATGMLEEVGPRTVIFDTAEAANAGGTYYSNEDSFWLRRDRNGLIKLLHMTYEETGALEVTNLVEYSYIKFPDPRFEAVQRATGGKCPILLDDAKLLHLGYDRAVGFAETDVDVTLDTVQTNGLKRWENMVTGTDENHLLLSTADASTGELSLKIELTEPDKVAMPGVGYQVCYVLSRSVAGEGWKWVGPVVPKPIFDLPLLDGNSRSLGASGFYRVSTLIVPDSDLAITNEIPSSNIVGVLEVASAATNTLTAVPWGALPLDPFAVSRQQVSVAGLVGTGHLDDGDSVNAANAGYIYQQWSWKPAEGVWKGSKTVTVKGVHEVEPAEDFRLSQSDAVWVSRGNPAERPYFLIGQYSPDRAVLNIAAGTESDPVCTLIPNPSLSPVGINDYPWGDAPGEFDLVRIPNAQGSLELLRWDIGRKEWGRLVPAPGGRGGANWVSDWKIPAGQGFWYHRCSDGFELTLPKSFPEAD